jgi:alpha-amylase
MPKDIMLELFSNETKSVQPSEYLDVGMPEYFDYAILVSEMVANEGQMATLRDVDAQFEYPSDNIVVFLDNHDTQRDHLAGVLTAQQNKSLYTLANVVMLAWPYGYPKIMSSFYIPYQIITGPDEGPPLHVPVHDGDRLNCGDGKTWVCEHRIPAIANMVAWRKVAGSASPRHWFEDGGDRIAFARGSAFVALNRKNQSWKVKLQTGMPAGRYCNIAQSVSPDSCPHVSVDADGFAEIVVPETAAVAFHKEAMASAMMAAYPSCSGQWCLCLALLRDINWDVPWKLVLLAPALLSFVTLIHIGRRQARENNDLSSPFLP